MMETLVEQRKDARSELTWPISVWLPEANRFFNGKSINISKGGTYISMPMTTPVKLGNEVEINFPRTQSLAKEKGQYARIKFGKVVRVERESLLQGAGIALGVEFA